jgi:hypothetical protein
VDTAYVYWSDWLPSYNFNGIRRAPIGGGSPTNLVTNTFNPNEHWPRYLAQDSTSLYWIATPYYCPGGVCPATSGVFAMTLPGSVPSVLTSIPYHKNDPMESRKIALDSGYVFVFGYTTTWEDSTLYRIPISGGAAAPIAAGLRRPQNIAATGGYVYYTVTGAGSPGLNDFLYRIPTAGGTATNITSHVLGFSDLEVKGSFAYLIVGSGSGSIERADVTVQLGPTTVLAPNQQGPRGLAVDATHVYWATDIPKAILRAPK